ncbi:hypothetical protein K0M31_006503, partial [Melipona bicolor]
MRQQGPDSNLEVEAEIKISRRWRQTSLRSALLPTRDNFVSRLRGAKTAEGVVQEGRNEIRGTESRGGASRQPRGKQTPP